MKYLVVMLIALAALVASEEEWKPILDPVAFSKITDDCKRESAVTTDQLEKISNGVYPNEKEVHDYVLCPALRMGIFTLDRGYNLDRMIAQLVAFGGNKDQLRDHVAGCIDNNEQKSSAAEWAFRGQQCMVKEKLRKLFKEVEKHEAGAKTESA